MVAFFLLESGICFLFFFFSSSSSIFFSPQSFLTSVHLSSPPSHLAAAGQAVRGRCSPLLHAVSNQQLTQIPCFCHLLSISSQICSIFFSDLHSHHKTISHKNHSKNLLFASHFFFSFHHTKPSPPHKRPAPQIRATSLLLAGKSSSKPQGTQIYSSTTASSPDPAAVTVSPLSPTQRRRPSHQIRPQAPPLPSKLRPSSPPFLRSHGASPALPHLSPEHTPALLHTNSTVPFLRIRLPPSSLLPRPSSSTLSTASSTRICTPAGRHHHLQIRRVKSATPSPPAQIRQRPSSADHRPRLPCSNLGSSFLPSSSTAAHNSSTAGQFSLFSSSTAEASLLLCSIFTNNWATNSLSLSIVFLRCLY